MTKKSPCYFWVGSLKSTFVGNWKVITIDISCQPFKGRRSKEWNCRLRQVGNLLVVPALAALFPPRQRWRYALVSDAIHCIQHRACIRPDVKILCKKDFNNARLQCFFVSNLPRKRAITSMYPCKCLKEYLAPGQDCRLDYSRSRLEQKSVMNTRWREIKAGQLEACTGAGSLVT